MEVYLPVSATVVMERFNLAPRHFTPKAQLIAAVNDQKWFTGIVSYGFVYSLLKGHALKDDTKTMVAVETHLHLSVVWISALTLASGIFIALLSSDDKLAAVVLTALGALPLLSIPFSKLMVHRFIQTTFLYDSEKQLQAR
ncbi:MAG: hypothetical protein C5B53_07910 [Candidatus Melainabacteria bacterium]|nr:MAG: hypothetical protein C5B53_07910 [Candidatus Melainabacteria bacterium]